MCRLQVNPATSQTDGIASIKKETRRFIRQQYNWFRLTDARILWLDATQAPYQAALAYLQEGKR